MTAEHVAGGDVRHVAAALTQAWATIAVQKAKFDKDDSIDPIRRPPKWLCELCRPTPAGIAAFYPEQYEAKTLQTISYIGNVILAELRRTRTSP